MSFVADYVLGFAFTTSGAVALIKKKRPEWQRDRWNGIGGHREGAETAAEAMSREFFEETGVRFDPPEWRLVGHMGERNRWRCSVFTLCDDRVYGVRTRTDEPVQLVKVDEHLHYFPVIENVPALIMLCQLKPDHTGFIPAFALDYTP